jgi:hypothetical protein
MRCSEAGARGRSEAKTAPGAAVRLVTDLHYLALMRGVVTAPLGFRSMRHQGVAGAGWRRAYRLASRLDAAAVHEMQNRPSNPLDSGEKSGIVKAVDVNVPPDQPPSTSDSPAIVDLRLGLSALGIAFVAFTPSPFPPPAQSPAAIPAVVSPPPG